MESSLNKLITYCGEVNRRKIILVDHSRFSALQNNTKHILIIFNSYVWPNMEFGFRSYESKVMKSKLMRKSYICTVIFIVYRS